MSVVRWILLIEVLGAASWPLCFLLFRRLPDGGFGVARLLGMFLLAYAAWFSSSVGLFPYDTASLASFLILYIIIAALIYQRNREEMGSFIREKKDILIFEQLFFLALLALVVFIQSYKPDITAGEAEKAPDLMFIRAILRSGEMPPEDLWFAGRPVNYYYFGYVVFANLMKLAAVRPEVGFNLAVASIVPLSCLGAFSLAYNVTGRRGCSLLAPLFLFGLGNFDAFARAVRAGGLAGRDWWIEMFAHGSRNVIPGTIHEFPWFSFLLGDLHPHYMFVPFCFLFLSMLLLFFVRVDDIFPRFFPRRWVLHGFLASLILGAVFMFHTWDYPIYVLLTVLAALALVYRHRAEGAQWGFIGWIIALIFLSYAFFLPFRLSFLPAAKADLRLVDAARRSPLGAFMTVNGLACFALFSFLIVELLVRYREGSLRPRPWALFCASAAIVCAGSMLTGCAVVGLVGAACLWAFTGIISDGGVAGGRAEPERLFVLTLAALCAAILLGCELVYLKDFYGEQLQRQNTVFKLYYQVWILSSVIFAAGTLFVLRSLRGASRIVWQAVLAGLVAVSLIYPFWGTYHRCMGFGRGREIARPPLPTLDGMAYIRYRYPAEYRAFQWIEEHTDEDDVVLEAAGRAFSFDSRVSAFTGRPTVIGWANHEALWRDWTWKTTMERSRDVDQIYNTEKKRAVKPLLDKYRISYIYVGPLERKKYGKSGIKAFEGSFPLAYRNEGVRIYKNR